MSFRLAEYPRPQHFILHLSDTHLIADVGGLYGSDVDSEAQLRLLFDDFEKSGGRPEAIVITGDLADRGEAKAYATLRGIVEPAAARLGAEVIWVMGNHDDRGAFRSGLLDQLPTTQPIDRVHDINGLRIIALDSTVPGAHHGEISDAQLDWLAEELSSPAPHGTILALHHPPVPSVLDLAVLVELRDQQALAEVIEGSDVRSIIAGHLHYSSTATFAGVPVSVASATCYTQDLNVPVGGTRARNGAQAFNLVHIYEQTVLHSVVPVAAGAEVSYVSAEQTREILAEQGIEIPSATAAPVVPEEALYPPIEERLGARG
ncbi:phosphodiesterase [Rathayibacter toxicus]|uniref:Phosphodiesterase n=1 Tax=Rathayibacter toxicus TaxID=145458 RepID=A0A0U1PRN0_9MICO|nr:phosphodiesterase [Rathayibacter toxicus]KKM44333.1 3',5'-cyclic-nucleotide phosphodiesterase [Rathayibacter toxicus]PPG20366.1 phosphodiesterase [Rathayibacter toxicus]PPG45467.1 phosphodiesterase [Rathayibacter toxicus]PPH22567.1 phosphodiesterase [Rathayibacter toxicus]PPH56768.1 phosphodiesterase [Rathayibacter toxicus]